MKRTYNIQRLAEKHGFQEDHIEKLLRISDILEDISAIPFLNRRLSLYGGTALNLIHFPQMPRLSVDADFNYRHQGEERDWGEIRRDIDDAYKQILYAQGYQPRDIRIDASYPLSRFTVHYTNHQGTHDSFKIETGYMHRMPILNKDAHMSFRHLGSDTLHTVTTPQAEEIYANKLVTLLSRATPRDLYDVSIIAETGANTTKLRNHRQPHHQREKAHTPVLRSERIHAGATRAEGHQSHDKQPPRHPQSSKSITLEHRDPQIIQNPSLLTIHLTLNRTNSKTEFQRSIQLPFHSVNPREYSCMSLSMSKQARLCFIQSP